MKLSLNWRSIPARVFLAVGLAAIMLSALLVASYLGLVPDADMEKRKHRVAVAESLAVTASMMLDEDHPEALRDTLSLIAQRHEDLRSMGVRRNDGQVLVEVGRHTSQWPVGTYEKATETHMAVPVFQGGTPWGMVEVQFDALHPTGWRGYLDDPLVRLAGFMVASCLAGFLIYLRRMLRQLDPSRSVPGRVRNALDTLTEGLLVIDTQGNIVLANQSLCEVLGMQPEALVGQPSNKLPWLTQEGVLVPLASLPWQAVLKNAPLPGNAMLYIDGVDGQRRTFRSNSSPIQAPGGSMQGVLVSLQDVTELEEKEMALKVAKDDAEHANQAKSQFLANMSHEIRTPMNAILGFTEVLRRGGIRNQKEASRQLDIIHGSGRHLLSVINDILDLSKVEAGRLETESIAFAPHTVTQEVIVTLSERAQDKGLTLRLDLSEALPATVMGDPARMRQVLTNLIGNALKFTESGGVTVSARYEPDQSRYVLAVTDTGVGIADDKLESVFEPFVQAEASTTRRFGGTGLGLTISRGLARAMGGDIFVTSTLGVGTTFALWLPVRLEDAGLMLSPEALRQEAAEGQPMAPGETWRFEGKCILVVDDAVENRELARVILEEVGLKIVEAENGALALDRVAEGGIDLVLMDMQMPVMDGMTATRRLRDLGVTLPILALTANAMKGIEADIARAGFDGFHTKPLQIDHLMADLARRLGGVKVTQAPPAPLETTPVVIASPVEAAPTTAPGDFAATTMPGALADFRPSRSGSLEAYLGATMSTPIQSRLASHPRLGKMVQRFAEQLPAKLAEMQTLFDQGKWTELAGLAHWLKGSGASVGFEELFEPSKALDDASRANNQALAEQSLALLHALGQRIQAGMPQATASESTPAVPT